MPDPISNPIRYLLRARPRAIALALLLSGALVTLLAAGCGTDSIASKSATEIRAASKTAAEHASSLRVQTNDTAGGAKLTSETQASRQEGRSRLSFGPLSYEAIRIGDTIYLKGNPAFYKRMFSHTKTKVPPDAWLKGTVASGELSTYATSTYPGWQIYLIFRNTGPITKGQATDVGAQKTIELKEQAKLYTGALYIATTGEPYPVKHTKHGVETGQSTITAWNEPVTLTAPADVIELSKLEHKAH